MHHRASPEIFRRAKELRMKLTPSENILWERIRANRLNDLHFRRQHPVSKYILDFYCHQYRLGIELDGEIHNKIDQKARDVAREEDLKALGIHILRFKNSFVIQETDEVLKLILVEIENLNKSL
ncbi:endonuclease domain-containing protein [Algoriphagus machipongonensis]|uniref:DNA (Cytosine-5-)-methyltransferase n=1 Tax=Algoriphagus machipongonensis TaxID=388413 RepID=A3HRG0_9BACT|nr:endonuclease domain-containing protein [Algoriphagus machipongonensis]EAZ82428.1 DNA (cytosine-5-)-methyltransferase [Algoriphagus machipongonensis]